MTVVHCPLAGPPADEEHDRSGGSVTNRPSRLKPLLGVVVLAVVLVTSAVAIIAIDPAGAGTPAASARPPTALPGPVAPTVPAPPPATTFRDFAFSTEVISTPTASKAQSKLWYADGQWWAGLFQPTTDRLTIFRLDWGTQRWIDTGVLIDERPFADADFLWSDDHLYVITAGSRGSRSNAARLLRFSYDTEASRFTLDPNFPVQVSDTGMPSAVIARDSAGTLWVTYATDGMVWFARSLDHDAQWTQPRQLPIAGLRIEPDDIASIVAFGPGLIGVMWSDQLLDSVFFSVHRDGDDDGAWSTPEVVVDGLGSSDDHINLKAFPAADGSTGVVAALKTSLDTGDRVNSLAPQILLAVRDADGVWGTHLVSRVREHHTRPVVIVDAAARMFYVAATSPVRGGEIFYKRTPIDAISFDTGKGERLITSQGDPRVSNTTTTKQALDPGTGLLVLASDTDTGRYLHGVIDLGGGAPTADPADPARVVPPAPPDPPIPVTLVNDDFGPWAPGPADGVAWSVREGEPPSALSIVQRGTADRALRIRAPARGPSVRACRSFAEVPGVPLSVSARVRLGARSPSDATILSIRGRGGEIASIRTTTIRAERRGVFAWLDRSTKVRSTKAFKAGRWYVLRLRIDPVKRTYSLRISDAKGKAIIRKSGIRWRAAVPAAREVCLEPGGGGNRYALEVTDIRIIQEGS